MSADRLRGSCLCGAVRYTVTGAVDGFVLCHCSRCRKGTGSAHGANLFAGGARLDWLSGAEAVRRYAVPETRHVRQFCAICGAPLPSLQMQGRLVVVPAGSLDEAPPRAPDQHIFCADRAPWEDAGAVAERYDGLPGG